MAVEKGKVKAALDAKFKGKSVSKELKESYASRWADRIENDEGIEEFINDRELDILDAAKEADRRATAATQKAKADAAAAINGDQPQDEQAPQNVPDGAPDWFKSYVQSSNQKIDTLTQQLTGLQQARSAETLAERFKKDERLKGVPDAWTKRAIPTKEEDFETTVADLQKEWSDFATANRLQVLGVDAPPSGGGVNHKPGSGKVDPAITAFAAQQKAQFETSKK